MIKRIELVNFMSHERTVIEPSDGLTVLIGPNNCGKSAFVAALQILCHNAKSNYVLRHGEKKCEIIVETDDGHVIQWSRKKSGSPKYLIDDQEFDRLKGGTPDELHEILKLGKVACEKDQFDVHFGEQKSPVFLLNDSGKASAQFFASSSDAIRLVEMQDHHKGKVRDAKRDQARLTAEKNRISEALEHLSPLTEIESKLVECESKFAEIKELENSIEQAEIIIRAIQDVSLNLLWHEATTECLSAISPPPSLDDEDHLAGHIATTSGVEMIYSQSTESAAALQRLTPLPEMQDLNAPTELVESLQASGRTLGELSALKDALLSLQSPPTIENESTLKTLVTQFNNAESAWAIHAEKTSVLDRLKASPEFDDQSPLQSLLQRSLEITETVSAADKSIAAIESQFESLNSELANWVKENPNCPTCGGETKVDQLLAGGHQHD